MNYQQWYERQSDLARDVALISAHIENELAPALQRAASAYAPDPVSERKTAEVFVEVPEGYPLARAIRVNVLGTTACHIAPVVTDGSAHARVTWYGDAPFEKMRDVMISGDRVTWDEHDDVPESIDAETFLRRVTESRLS